MEGRELRRLAGFLAVRLPEVDLEAVPDPRAREGRWSLGQILRATLVGLMAGCKSLWETEDLTDRLSAPMRRMLRVPRRLADTTMRDALCKAHSSKGCAHRCTEPFGPRGAARRSRRWGCPSACSRSTAR